MRGYSTQTHSCELAIPNEKMRGTVPLPLVHQNRRWALIPLPTGKRAKDLRIAGAGFTTVGRELLKIVDIEEDSAFLTRVQTYFRSRHLEMIPVSGIKK